MRKRKYRTFCADFETTVYSGQDHTEVWSAALVEIGTEDVLIFHSISEFFDHVFKLLLKNHIRVYFHNLKFDGVFCMDYLLHSDFKQAIRYEDPANPYTASFAKDSAMMEKTYKYMISDMAQWYMITIKYHQHFLLIQDSFKLLPFSVENIGKSFGTKHKKLNMEYEGFRYAGCEITPQEAEYIKNDVLVMSEALQIMFDGGHDRLTIGSCCLHEYKDIIGHYDFKELFPDMTKFPLDKSIYGSDNADAYIRKAYRGGWCYVARGKEGKTFHNGITLDVNSLYPSCMTSEIGIDGKERVYPVYDPVFWKGDYIPDDALKKNRYYYIRFRCRFDIRPGYLPTIQIKNSMMYANNEYLETSEMRVNGKYYQRAVIGHEEVTDRVTLTLTCTDFELMKEHYFLYDMEILDGCWFYAKSGIFDSYIQKYKKMKQESTGAARGWAKLALNNLYGKMATGDNSSFKICYLKEDDTIGYYTITEHNKKVVYIPAGAAITAYAREFTIRAAQMNYYGVDNPGFIYADTDSLHMDIPIEQVKGVKIDDKEFLCWKCEAQWKRGLFLRQKTYIETDDETCNVTACGMGKRCKELISSAITGADPGELSEPEQEFMERFHKLEDFQIGLEVPSNLKQKRMKGGVVLMEDYFCIR